MQQSEVTIVGTVGTAPQLGFGQGASKVPWTQFRVVSTRRRPQGEIWVDGDTTWSTVKCFGELARNVCSTLHKGHEVVVIGQLVVEEWSTKDGQPRTSHAIKADQIGASLGRQEATIRKIMRTAPGAEQTDEIAGDHESSESTSETVVPDDASSLRELETTPF